MAGKTPKRKDSNRTVLKTGESQRKDGSYDYRWTDLAGKRHSVYAKTLAELREKEKEIDKEIAAGIKHHSNTMTTDELFELWIDLKRGVRSSTVKVYRDIHKYQISPLLGDIIIKNLSFSTIKKTYIVLYEEQGKSRQTIKMVHQVLMQMLDFAVDDNLLVKNCAKKAFSEFQKEMGASPSKKYAMTQEEQESFLKFISSNAYYKKWKNLIVVLNGTGMRVGEALALQWEDIDFLQNEINIEKTFLAVDMTGGEPTIHPPKTKSSIRKIPMSEQVRQALLGERDRQTENNIVCAKNIQGYDNFVFLNSNGNPMSHSGIDSALYRMVNTYNKNVVAYSSTPSLLPQISCHTFRHNFATRLFECGVDGKVIQHLLGHNNIATTMNTYTDIFSDRQQEEIVAIDQFLTPKFTPIGT